MLISMLKINAKLDWINLKTFLNVGASCLEQKSV